MNIVKEENYEYIRKAFAASYLNFEVISSFILCFSRCYRLKLFWQPGKIYASGITGFAQILQSVSERYLPFTLATSVMYFVLNIPLFILGWFKIGHRFTILL